MRELIYTVTAEYDGQSLQSFLRRGNGYSTRMLARIKQIDRGMTADGLPVRTIDRVKTGQKIVLKLPEDVSLTYPSGTLASLSRHCLLMLARTAKVALWEHAVEILCSSSTSRKDTATSTACII